MDGQSVRIDGPWIGGKREKVSEMKRWMSESKGRERSIKAMKNPLFYPRVPKIHR